ncbi:TPA: HNH endonuclease [Morganella morganii]|nr:HNH endonuclease [Morganella morganii subsp. morganii]HAT1528993.1 hypothetical protein [Morganella morganii]HDF2366127.1 HNH endonuclease [Morganella morganii]HDF2421089.1 HNH endonuclease [Morganella morganii]
MVVLPGRADYPAGYPRRSPLPELTWHHEANQPGVMQLVPIKQHQSP